MRYGADLPEWAEEMMHEIGGFIDLIGWDRAIIIGSLPWRAAIGGSQSHADRTAHFAGIKEAFGQEHRRCESHRRRGKDRSAGELCEQTETAARGGTARRTDDQDARTRGEAFLDHARTIGERLDEHDARGFGLFEQRRKIGEGPSGVVAGGIALGGLSGKGLERADLG